MDLDSFKRVRTSALVALFALIACSPPPRGTSTEPAGHRKAADAPTAPADSETVYDFEREGTFPPASSDVAFEEDQLPPRPENMDATPVQEGSVRSSDVEESSAQDQRREPTVTTPSAPSVTTPAPGAPTPMRMGFRVQLIAAADRLEAEQFAREARSRLGVAIHVEFEAPYYKVRAGDFRDRADALVLRDRARANGYEGAWVTASRIAP